MSSILLRPRTAYAFTRASSRLFSTKEYQNVIASRPVPSVALLTLNRPKALNALSTPLFQDLNAALLEADAEKDIGAIVITGSEKAFAAGADIKELKEKDFASAYNGDLFAEWSVITKIRKPVIAAVSGYALGGGCELAMMCDMILASPTAVFGQPEINLGVSPGGGGTQRLTHIVGKYRAMELVLTGRNFSAKEAEQWGLVSRIVGEGEGQVVKEAVELAQKIASKGQIAVQATKEMINAAYELPLTEGVRFERRLFFGLFSTKDKQEDFSAPRIVYRRQMPHIEYYSNRVSEGFDAINNHQHCSHGVVLSSGHVSSSVEQRYRCVTEKSKEPVTPCERYIPSWRIPGFFTTVCSLRRSQMATASPTHGLVPVSEPTALAGETSLKLPAQDLFRNYVYSVHVIPSEIDVERFKSAVSKAVARYPHTAGRLVREGDDWRINLTNSPVPVRVAKISLRSSELSATYPFPNHFTVQPGELTQPFLNSEDYGKILVPGTASDPLLGFKLTIWENGTAIGISWSHTCGDAFSMWEFSKCLSAYYVNLDAQESELPLAPSLYRHFFRSPFSRQPEDADFTENFLPRMPHLAKDYDLPPLWQKYAGLDAISDQVQLRLSGESIEKMYKAANEEGSSEQDKVEVTLNDALAAYLIKVLNQCQAEPVHTIILILNYRGSNTKPSTVTKFNAPSAQGNVIMV
ncbi:hypothetical protein FRB90_003052, partial [Tulasnella sp. 427]